MAFEIIRRKEGEMTTNGLLDMTTPNKYNGHLVQGNSTIPITARIPYCS